MRKGSISLILSLLCIKGKSKSTLAAGKNKKVEQTAFDLFCFMLDIFLERANLYTHIEGSW